MLAKWCSKFSKPDFNSMWTVDFQMFKLDLEKAEEPEIKLPTSSGLSNKQESSKKHLLLLYWLCQSLWLCGSQETVENSERDGNTSWAISNPKRWCCESAALNMPANLENSAVAKVEKVSFHSNPKERQCQRMLKLLHDCTHLTH